MKKVVLALLALAALAVACTLGTGEVDFETEEEDGNLTITGYTGSGGNVVIPSKLYGQPVIAIGDEAFSGKGLTGLTIPDSVTSIGYYAFANNYLESLTIPDTVTTVKRSAFSGNRLVFVTIPDSLGSIEGSVFEENRLSSVTIPDSVTTIGPSAFADNPLTNVTLGANVTIEASAFPYPLPGYYQNHGKKAGEYSYSGGSWSYSPR
ncbi:MAG: leucine-rich repeat domain-containing protein [Spirochaetaceae bacterium]|nr:leucine-rich repeat domain-containing protein [Spirochaetaceae bacterium]